MLVPVTRDMKVGTGRFLLYCSFQREPPPPPPGTLPSTPSPPIHSKSAENLGFGIVFSCLRTGPIFFH